jgi:hypothetical protein
MRYSVPVILCLLLFGCSSTPSISDIQPAPAHDAFPLEDYPIWDGWEQYKETLSKSGYGKFFVERVGLNVTEWWVALVEPGTYDFLSIVVTTSEGTYSSDSVYFTSYGGQHQYACPPITVDIERFERFSLEGEMRVVAFAHFPDPPKGRIVKWEVTP